MTAPGNMENYAMTIRELESLTGFDFLYNLPDSIEELVETTASFKEWNKR
jgi:DNA/RNA endonuclease G (NUC1)